MLKLWVVECNEKMKKKKIAIVGVGFMGGSLALDLKKNFPQFSIWGFARSERSFKKLKRLRILDKVEKDLAKLIDNADFIVLGLPVYTIIEYFKKISPFLKKGAIVFDLGSSKGLIDKKAKNILPKGVDFIGCHPLCGSEKSGAQHSRKGLYKGSLCIITSSPAKKSVKIIKSLWEKIGSEVIFLSSSGHDKILSSISHFPHVISFSVTDFVPKEHLRIPIASLKDLTRISNSPSSVWADIFLSNKANILKDMNRFKKVLSKFEKALKKNDRKKICSLIEQINKKQKILQDKSLNRKN